MEQGTPVKHNENEFKYYFLSVELTDYSAIKLSKEALRNVSSLQNLLLEK